MEADYFLLQVYNPQTEPILFSLAMGPSRAAGRVPLAKLYKVDPGYHEILIHMSEVRTCFDPGEHFTLNLVPNIDEGPVTAYFGAMDFVKFRSPADDPYAGRKMKALIWDLDNTLWDGILVESDPDRLELRDGVREILQALDQRGILLGIASKNDHDLALAVLERLGVDEYFLHPQIHWDPKSLSMRRIRQALNIGMDAIAFVDDSVFERAEVARAVPEALVLDAVNYQSLLDYPCFAGSASADSRNRRKYYQAEGRRTAELNEGFEDDYESFLRSCRIQLEIRRAEEANFGRINDLIQRTNQMNFSANRHTREEVAELLRREDLEEYVLSASDRFGNYGIIGFALVDREAARMTDLLFSCRIQMKHIEHAFLCHVLAEYRRRGAEAFEIVYCPTKRNAQCARVFGDLGFAQTGQADGRQIYSLPLAGALPAEEMVTIVAAP
jgi:FkbH-like protein